MIKTTYRPLFIISDIVFSGVAWSLFFIYRKQYIESVKFGLPVPFLPDFKFYAGLVLIPLFWFLLFYAAGAYADIRRKKQMQNARQLFFITVAGVLFLFFALLLDDIVISYKNYYQSFVILFILQFTLVLTGRAVLLAAKDRRFKQNKDGFKVLVLGNLNKVTTFLNENASWISSNHFIIAGYIEENQTDERSSFPEPRDTIDHLCYNIDKTSPDEIFIVSDTFNASNLEKVLLKLCRKDVYIRILPELYSQVNIPLKVATISEAPLFLFLKDIMPGWQQTLKNLFDIVLSMFALILLTPLVVILVIWIKATSRGPLIYSQERIGKNGKPFKILKFRSMLADSEPDGPRLASGNDNRITSVGRFMRKRRLDEIPNFINVLKGEMSLVGPRPEREYFIKQILERAPQYAKLHLVKPGITSWGQVKYGYAKDIDEMILRMHYDLVYIENMSLFADFQILMKTINIILRGQGV
jgi:exopolysaccharide biosynthesis polyprenyl glycosylphosphotransferase